MKRPATPTARPLAELAPDPGNPRRITPEAAAGLRFSLDRYGDLSGIVFDAEAGVLVSGHQRLDQLRAAGVAEWTVERECDAGLTAPDGPGAEGTGWIAHTSGRFRVRLVRWTEQTRGEANLVANSDQIAGEWTPAALPKLAPLAPLPALAPLRFGELRMGIARLFPAADLHPPAVASGEGAGTERTFRFVLGQDDGAAVDRAFAALRKAQHGADDAVIFFAAVREAGERCG